MDIPMKMIICCNCNQPFAVSEELYERLHECHNTFYCPAGHGQHFTGESDTERLSKMVKSRDALIDSLKSETRERQGRIEAQEAEIIRLKKSLKRARAKSQ